MPSEKDAPFDIGPFTGGLNQLEDPRLIGDDQLAVCQNLDIGRAGELTVRAGLRLAVVFANNQRLIGTALLVNNTHRAFNRNTSATGIITYADGNNITTTNAWNTCAGSAVAGATEKLIQYSNSAWIIPKDVQFGTATVAQGYRFTLDTNTGSTVTAMPRGTGAVAFKDRLFIFGPVDASNAASQRVYYSAATDFTSFPAANFFDINPGDGEGITAAAVIADTLIFFKRHSTYALFYDTDPGLGTLRRVNTQIGATGPDSVVAYENALYIIDERTVYKIQNLLFTDIGKNLNLKNKRTTVVFGGSGNRDYVTNFGPRIVFIVYTGSAIPYSYYVYNTEIEAWAEYTFSEQPERFYRVVNSTSFEDQIASKTNSTNLYVLSPFRSDDPAFGDYPGQVTTITVQTKRYGDGPASVYKRMFWWGLEVMATAGASVTMTAISTGVLTGAPAVITGNGQFRFFKAFNAMRFRYVEFLITTTALRLTIQPGMANCSSHTSTVNAASSA